MTSDDDTRSDSEKIAAGLQAWRDAMPAGPPVKVHMRSDVIGSLLPATENEADRIQEAEVDPDYWSDPTAHPWMDEPD